MVPAGYMGRQRKQHIPSGQTTDKWSGAKHLTHTLLRAGKNPVAQDPGISVVLEEKRLRAGPSTTWTAFS